MARIALLPSAYLPTLGGVQELTRALGLALREAGDEVEVWVPADAESDPESGRASESGRVSVEVLDGLTVRRFPMPLPAGNLPAVGRFLGGAPRTLLAMRRAVREFRPDVLHVQCFGPNGVYATALSRLTGVPLVVTLQGETVMDDHDIYEHSAFLRAGLRRGLQHAAAVTACSEFTRADAVARFGLSQSDGSVVFNGVSIGGPDAPDLSVDVPQLPERFVLALGRVVPKKGFDLLLRAFAQVADRHPDVVLAIGGSGGSRPELLSLAEELGVAEQVRLVGRLNRNEVAVAMRRADLFVMPSRLEPFGIVVLEAWRAGATVLATSRGGPPEFVTDGVTGLLCDPFDTGALAAVLDRALSDQQLRESLGAAAQKAVEEFAWPVIAGQYRDIYATITG